MPNEDQCLMGSLSAGADRERRQRSGSLRAPAGSTQLFFSGFFSISYDFFNFAVTDKAGKLRAHFGLFHTRCSRRFCSADSKVLNLK